jgi:excisionase family DNA binding protein
VKYVNSKKASELLGISMSSLYKKVAVNGIPFYRMKGSNKLKFIEQELINWVESNCIKIKTSKEIIEEVEACK